VQSTEGTNVSEKPMSVPALKYCWGFVNSMSVNTANPARPYIETTRQLSPHRLLTCEAIGSGLPRRRDLDAYDD
jgi:hypothetical protein